jgi:molybdenum cofactor cytidylyltransferase
MSPNIAGVILAAGESSRMGRPKLLLPWGNTSVLGQVLSTLAIAKIDPLLVITGAHHDKVGELVAKLTKNYPVQCMHNPNYASGGMLSSIQCGIRDLLLSSTASPQEDQIDAALVMLGDQPQIKLETILAIYSAFKQNGSELVLPSYNNHRGHPWLIARPLWAQLLALSATMTPRQFLQNHNHQIVYIPADESILQDLDTPDDYLRHQP